jgi:hypothetical protein
VAISGFLFLGALFGGLAFVMGGLTRSPRPGEVARGWQVFMGVCVLVLAPLPYLMLRGQLRIVRERHPHIVVSEDALVVHDGSIFVSPQRIARLNIVEIRVGPGVSTEFSASSPWRKPLKVVLAAYPEVPNAVISLKEPTRLDRAYVPFPAYRAWIGRPPTMAESIRQIWIPFADPAASYRALSPWARTHWIEEE